MQVRAPGASIPAMSSLAALAEARIQEAIDAGDFDGLACHGQPLDLEAYFSAPASLRAGFGMLKSAGVVPPEVEAIRQVHFLRERLAQCSDEPQREALRAELATREVELAMAMERMRRTLRADMAEG